MKRYLLWIAIQIIISVDCYSQTNVSGTLTGNVTWDLAGSPYVVTGDITISQGAELRINPAVVIKVGNGFGFFIDGTIRAIGTSDSLIEFKSNQLIPPTVPVYHGFCFSSNSIDYNMSSGTGCILQYCKIENAGTNNSNCFSFPFEGVVYSNSSCPYVDNCIFYQCSGIIGGANLHTDFYFTNNKIISCTGPPFGLIYLSFQPGYAAVFSCNIFKDVDFSFASGLYFSGRHVECSNNIFTSNILYIDLTNSNDFTFNNNMVCNNAPLAMPQLIGISDTLQHNLFAYNKGILEFNFVRALDTLALITNNKFIGNTLDTTVINSYFIFNHILRQQYNSPLINATSNYWGTTNVNDIDSLIFDYNDDTSYHQINFQPFLISPDTNAPVSPVQNIIRTNPGGNNVQLTWDANPESDIAGYRIYWGGYTGYSFSNHIDVGNVTAYALSGVAISDSISVTAYDNNSFSFSDFCSGRESWFSMPRLTLVGINEFDILSKLSIFPNPASKFVTIKYPQLTTENCQLVILDLFGREMLKKKITREKEIILSVSEYSNGIYFLEIKTENNFYRAKWVKQ